MCIFEILASVVSDCTLFFTHQPFEILLCYMHTRHLLALRTVSGIDLLERGEQHIAYGSQRIKQRYTQLFHSCRPGIISIIVPNNLHVSSGIHKSPLWIFFLIYSWSRKSSTEDFHNSQPPRLFIFAYHILKDTPLRDLSLHHIHILSKLRTKYKYPLTRRLPPNVEFAMFVMYIHAWRREQKWVYGEFHCCDWYVECACLRAVQCWCH